MAKSTAIAAFPKFSQLRLGHKAEVKKITSMFPPYSDFNFTSLYSWDVDSSAGISVLDDNLVIKLPDYITGRPIYSILGANNIIRSVEVLLKRVGSLELVPAVSALQLKKNKLFSVRVDRDSFDYIYSLNKLAGVEGKEYRGKRKRLARFEKNYLEISKLEKIDFSDPGYAKNLGHVFADWAAQRGKIDKEIRQESLAIQRLLQHSADFNLIGYKLSISDRLVGFVINEQINNDYMICHFQKSILEYPDIDTYLSIENARLLHKTGCRYINWEQDLGLPGLRGMKLSYKPARFLKKYTVTTR